MTEPLTVILWLWNGWRPVYTNRHVNAMAGMLFDNLSIPHRLLCVTDNPEGIEIETMPIWDLMFNGRPPHRSSPRPNPPNCYRRLKLFSDWGKVTFPGQVWSIDLDAVIFKEIDSLWVPDDFKINKGRAAPYNGGMWLLRTGSRPQVWDQLSVEALKKPRELGYVGSDQAWLSYILPKAPTWSAEDGVFHYTHFRTGRPPLEPRMMFFAGGVKPWDALCKRKMPTVYEQYMRYYR